MIFLWYPRCSTCKKAKKWLDEHDIKYTLRDIVLDNPNKEELREWILKSKIDVNKFFNTSGVKYRELGLKDKLKDISFDEKIELLASDGMLVKRPLIIGDKIIVGFKNYEEMTNYKKSSNFLQKS